MPLAPPSGVQRDLVVYIEGEIAPGIRMQAHPQSIGANACLRFEYDMASRDEINLVAARVKEARGGADRRTSLQHGDEDYCQEQGMHAASELMIVVQERA